MTKKGSRKLNRTVMCYCVVDQNTKRFKRTLIYFYTDTQ